MPTDLPPANEVIPHTQVSPASDRASSRASSIWVMMSPPWPPYSSPMPMAWNPASASLPNSSCGKVCSSFSSSRAHDLGSSRLT